ncbi:MAG TPA: hypothetical protein VNK24_01575 [Elusimicrobiota bacterium]|nr:hypothetical protein [Elusimicrobiota bacterium]
MGAVFAGAGEGNYARYGFDDAFGSKGAPTTLNHRFGAGVVLSSSAEESLSASERLIHLGLNGDPEIPGGPPTPSHVPCGPSRPERVTSAAWTTAAPGA